MNVNFAIENGSYFMFKVDPQCLVCTVRVEINPPTVSPRCLSGLFRRATFFYCFNVFFSSYRDSIYAGLWLLNFWGNCQELFSAYFMDRHFCRGKAEFCKGFTDISQTNVLGILTIMISRAVVDSCGMSVKLYIILH